MKTRRKKIKPLKEIRNHYFNNPNKALNINTSELPLEDVEKSLIIEDMSYCYVKIFLQICYLIMASKDKYTTRSAQFIAGYGNNGAQCSTKTVYRFLNGTKGILVKVKRKYFYSNKGIWMYRNELRLTKFGRQLYKFFYMNFLPKATRAIKKKGAWQKKFEEMKTNLRKEFHERKKSIKDILMKATFKFSEAMNTVHKWYTTKFHWGRAKYYKMLEQLKKKNVPASVINLSQPEKRNYLERTKKSMLKSFEEKNQLILI